MAAAEQVDTAVVIIGAGIAGLTLAAFLHESRISYTIVERHPREYIETRQRAGVVDGGRVQMFARWGLADTLLGGPVATAIEYRVNGQSRVFTAETANGTASRFCTQQMLVASLLKLNIDVNNGDVRFGTSDIVIENDVDKLPVVSYIQGGSSHRLTCRYVVGCDGSRGTSRASIPQDAISSQSYDYGYAWLAALIEVPTKQHPIMGVSDKGFVAQIPRGPTRSRFYLQCSLSDGAADWPDQRIFDELRMRLHDETIESAPVLNKEFVPLKSVLFYPMQFNNLFLAGDVAHLVPPTGAKGMNLALHDVDILAQALNKAIHKGDTTDLEGYSQSVLPHLLRYQEFSAWMTDTMHDAGDPTLHGQFRQTLARARLDELFSSPSAASLHSGYLNGVA